MIDKYYIVVIIFEDFGCSPDFYYSMVYIALIRVPEITIPLIGFILCVSSQGQSSSHLTISSSPGIAIRNLTCLKATSACNSQTTLTVSRFIRLLALCAVVGIWPLLAILLWHSLSLMTGKVPPWLGWAAVHEHFDDIPANSCGMMTPDER
jgi:hypothetical protein